MLALAGARRGVVEQQRCLVAEHGGLRRPERVRDQLLVVDGRVVDEPEDPPEPTRTLETAALDMELQERQRVGRLARLSVRAVAGLRGGELEEPVPDWRRSATADAGHART